MNNHLRMMNLGLCLAITTGCAQEQVNTFIFTADLPPDFAYVAAVYYSPARGESCTVEKRDNKALVFNREWRKEYTPDSRITIRTTRKGCPLVINRIKLKINSAYGQDWSDVSHDTANVVIRDELENTYKGTFNEAGESRFYGQCQWLFRTSGKPRILRKILDCKKTNPLGEPGHGRPFTAYALEQLPDKTVKMKISLAPEEEPYFTGKWVKFKNGYKRCMGKGFEDQHAFCLGNFKDFSTFQMIDGRICSVYPGCIE